MTLRARNLRGTETARERRTVFIAHASAVLAVALWVRTLDARVGFIAVLAQMVAAGLAWRRARRMTAGVLAVSIVATVLVIARHERLWGDRVPAGAALDGNGARALETSLRNAVADAQGALASAAAVVASGAAPDAALPARPSDVGVIVYVRDSVAAWAGRTVIAADALWERDGVVVTPLYVVQYATSVRGDRRAVATNVIAARAPADRLTRSLAGALAIDVGGAGAVEFDVTRAAGADSGTTVEVGGTRLAIAARVRDPAALAAAFEQRSRTRGSMLLLAVVVIALSALLRRAERLRERLAVTAIPLGAIALTPLNALSNVSRLFDPATYYVTGGGAFTASVGALAMTSALVLFAVMAAVRARSRPRRQWAAVAAVVGVAMLAPYLLRDLARGINLPPGGAETALWLAWEVALFLAATSFLAAGSTAGHWALGARRGFPLWVAPALAAVAALLGPALLRDGAVWPVWYPALWVAAIVALVLARRSRGGIFASAFVAACGATVLLWGATLRERVELAARDVQSMSEVDAAASALLERFAASLPREVAPHSAEELLRHYAASDLASADYPVVLAHWPPRPGEAPTLLSLRGEARVADVRDVVDAARRTATAQLAALAPNPATSLVLAVPYASGDVVTVVVGARAHLVRAQGFVELLGLPGVPLNPPYALTTTPGVDDQAPRRTPWRRVGNHLHADWSGPVTTGADFTPAVPDMAPTRIRADVQFDTYETLVPRGLLVVLLDLSIVLVLLIVDLLADGVLARWFAMRRPQWARSFRVRLSVALFAFFVVPALAFALWSYRRLHDDDRAARALLVREALRRAAVLPPAGTDAGEIPAITNVPGDVPLFMYRNGQLIAASDSLLLAVAPIGRWIPAEAQRQLAERDQLVATAALTVGAGEMLFGFRPVAPGLVIAAPARRDDAALDKRRSDLGVLVILASVLGGIAALWLSGVASRQLARPIATLRDAARAVAGGSRAPLRNEAPPTEFVPVFRAFDRMARDLAESEAQLTRAERVFAWGEMARQVAHEIKNPLTPIRLGVQHMLRAWRDRRGDFGPILEENATRVLQEIDHLDATARSFSRFGMPPEASAGVSAVDVAAIVRDVVALHAAGGASAGDGGAPAVDWRALGAERPCTARARAHELHEVLLNLCDNARNAGAHRVEIGVVREADRVAITVRDDGKGIPEHLRARVFEPHFSTSTSGSGLGLAISRRLVEGWGGNIALAVPAPPEAGTIVRLELIAEGGAA